MNSVRGNHFSSKITLNGNIILPTDHDVGVSGQEGQREVMLRCASRIGDGFQKGSSTETGSTLLCLLL